ncbi:MAG: hypothetical protein KatS3mg001_216 [Candidatus Pacearchaeota archaeon]|nr:MAG: hypothetical protein KatS3mg001_216 [Candidatus Pacearchaeota archaeon]
MLTQKQIFEIKKALLNYQNPIFMFDNDQDGLCSFLLLRRFFGKGEGISIKSFPDLNKSYFKKVKEFSSDCVFILDKPVVSGEFFEEIKNNRIPVFWIDHHHINLQNIPKFVHYYNPLFNKKKGEEPVTYLSYQITKNKEDIWIAVIGCISDKFFPNFYKEFEKKFPDLTIKSKNPSDIFYKSPIGKIARILGFALNDKPSNVKSMIEFLINCKSPYEILNENQENKKIHKRFSEVYKKYEKLLLKAKSQVNKEKLLFFKYSGELSISGHLSNELIYNYPDKIVLVAYIKGLKTNISMRGKKSLKILLESIKGIEGASGGGHEEAVGGQIPTNKLDEFKENLIKTIKHFN